MQIPYLDFQVQRWILGTVLALPSAREFQGNLSLLEDLLDHCNGRIEDLPYLHFRTFQLVRLADYIGCDIFLSKVANLLGISVFQISNTHTIREVRTLIRDRYRWAENKNLFLTITAYPVCHETVSSPPPTLPCVYYLPCCRGAIHHSCLKDLSSCPACEQPFRILPCCVCRGYIVSTIPCSAVELYDTSFKPHVAGLTATRGMSGGLVHQDMLSHLFCPHHQRRTGPGKMFGLGWSIHARQAKEER